MTTIHDALSDPNPMTDPGTDRGGSECTHLARHAIDIAKRVCSEIRVDRSSEAQHYRMAGLNLLAAIVIHWNTAHLGEAVRQRKLAGPTVEPELLAHVSPLGWAHILLTGEYRWPKRP